MTTTFEYGVASIKELRVQTGTENTGRSFVKSVTLGDRVLRPTTRFWNSLHLRFGFTSNIFRYFSHAEVFQRIAEKAPNDKFRYCVEAWKDGTGNLLAVSTPGAAFMRHNDIVGLLHKHG